MSIHAALHHVTHYTYDQLVELGPHVIRLRPTPHCRSNVLSYALKVEPAHFINWQQDPFANYLARLVFHEKTTEFRVTVDLVVEMAVYNPFDFFLEPTAEKFPFSYEAATSLELTPYLATLALTPKFQAYCKSIDMDALKSEPIRTIDFLVQINQKLQQDVDYLIRMEPGVQTPEETLSLGSGSCRDSAWLMVQLLRQCGLAARFVSGYLIQLTPDVKSLDGPSALRWTSRICMLGARFISQVQVGSASTQPLACSLAKAIFLWPVPHSRQVQRPSKVWWTKPRWRSAMK